MNNFWKKIKTLIIILVFCSFSLAQEESFYKSYEITKDKLNQLDKTTRQILSYLYIINKRIKKIEEEKTDILRSQAQIRYKLEDLKKEIKGIQTKAKRQKKKISKKLRAIYKTGGSGLLASFISDVPIQDRAIHLKIMANLARSEKKLIQSYKKDIILLEKKKIEFNRDMSEVKILIGKMSQKEKRFKKEFEQRREFVEKLKRDKKNYISRLAQIRHKAGVKYIQDSLKPSIYEKKGELIWPIEGRLSERFGFTRLSHEVFLNHKGVFFAAPANSEVKSVFSGKVVYARFYEGYGFLIMIDHGNHYYSLYGYNQKTQVKEGQEIKTGQVIAFSGRKYDSVFGFKEGLYFELRHFSEANNPLFWLNNERKMKISSYFQGESL